MIKQDVLSDFSTVDEPPKPPPPPKPKPPKYVAFLDSIPTDLRDQVIAALSARFIRSFVENQTAVLIRPSLQTKKKQHQKRLRDERAQKARIEEKQRMTAMRQRRQVAIDRIADEVASPIIRSFIRAEIEAIFDEEAAIVRDEQVVSLDAKIVPPVVLSGLSNRKHLNPIFLREVFSGFQFAVDDEGGPKIRFRYAGNRCDVLLYMASIQDVQRLVSQKSIAIDYVMVKLSVEAEDEAAVGLQNYTGQGVLLYPNARNVEDFHEKKGRRGLIGMSPVFNIEGFLEDGEGRENEVK
jgi:hypothetical protein